LTAIDLLARLAGVRGRAPRWSAKCPAHDDHEPSLSVCDVGDRLLVKCHAGCPIEQVMAAVGWSMSDLFADRRNGQSSRWDEQRAADELALRGLRPETIHGFQIAADCKRQAWRFPLGNGRMKFKAFQAGKGPKYWVELGTELGVYHLKPCHGAAEAWLLEGEPDVWVAHQAGVTAFSLTGGAGNYSDAAIAEIRNARIGIVHVLYDADKAGIEGGRAVAAALAAAGQAVVRHELSASRFGPGADVTTVYNSLACDDAAFGAFLAALPSAANGAGARDKTAGAKAAGPDAETQTDTGNAARLVGLHGARLHYIPQWGKWLVWNPELGCWILDHCDVQVRELAKDVGRALRAAAAHEPNGKVAKRLFAFALKSLDTRGIGGMVDLARGIAGIPLEHEALDRNGWILGVQNGVIDLRTGKLRPFDPADLMMMQAPVTYDAQAQAPRWQQALIEWFPDPEVRVYVQRVAGSALVGAQQDHVFVILYGGGRNGKGTFIRALQHLLGPYAVVIHLSLLVESKYSQHDTVKAALFRARLAVASETQRRVKLDEASVKNLTGGDRITARRMRENPWEFDPTHSLWLQTNHLPEISGRDRGIWSRIRVVKFETTFAEQDQERTLDATLAAEAPGILRWQVEGCLAWQREGLAEPEPVIRETLAYRQREDTFARFASESGLVFRRDLEIQAGELQRLLTEWADAEGIDPRHPELGAWLTENGARQHQRRETGPDGKPRRPRYWRGLGILADQDDGEQTDALA
jgi:putative DNA primase/helicase